jgi:hypothetical protein
MNYIQENTKDVNFYTSLKDIEKWLEIDIQEYDWHLSDIEGAWQELDDPSWVLGSDLAAKLNEFDFQFVWAVISVFPKGAKQLLSEKPFADGNQEFWEGSPKKQLADSLFEIVCWDSSATLFIGLPEELAKKLLNNAPGIKNLDEMNVRRKS